MTSERPHPLMRPRDGHEAAVSYVELLFDLIYVFAIIQVSHFLLEHLSLLGAAQALLLWFAVWLGWQYSGWMTNWFDPDTTPIRLVLFVTMALALMMAAALPEAFGDRGLIFAGCFAAMQVGRSLFILLSLRGHALADLTANYQRILGWACIGAVFWLAGGLVEGPTRLVLWALAVACEYVSPMFGFRLPGLGRSYTRHWTIEGGHLIERCALFMIIALGETILITGATLAGAGTWSGGTLLAFGVAFLETVAMWWVYFHIAIRDASRVITESDDPGRIGAYFHYVHVIILGSVILCAVGSELVIAHPVGHLTTTVTSVLLAGPMAFLAGMAIYKFVVYGRPPLSHLVGLLLMPMLLIPLTVAHSALLLQGASAVLLLGVGTWEMLSRQGALRI
ncbi:low temperature requirement protein A [Halomonas elongata]|uniref:low temperature requirement protein A n=1 Tax=Halomonas elongata TaxID=2746 RepID=UPI00186B95EB|nr:low temperature requirement protein A [Halomonas elongata]MBW5799138.1 low temperature requirement protein A [Halomonas elongata]